MIDPSDDDEMNTLQWFVITGDDAAEDTKRLNVLKELRRSGLILKKDIREYHLLEYSRFELTKERFEYLVNWDPDALIKTRVRNKPLIHYFVDEEESLQLLLKAGFNSEHLIQECPPRKIQHSRTKSPNRSTDLFGLFNQSRRQMSQSH